MKVERWKIKDKKESKENKNKDNRKLKDFEIFWKWNIN